MNKICINNKVLDSQQTNVVLCDARDILVVAGAGSGKTLTIVGKVKYLIEKKKILPEEILCISFCNDSVNSLMNKLKEYNIDIMTFHKLGLNILKEELESFSICDNDYLEYVTKEFLFGIVFENKRIMKNILRYFGIFSFFNIEKKYKIFIHTNYKKVISFSKLITKFIRLFKTNNYSISSFIDFKKSTFMKKEKLFLSIVFNVYLIYKNELDSSGLIDFDDMLIKSTTFVDKNDSINKYKYIIVDEYQDTSYIRYLLIKKIIDKTNAKFMAVGDDFQSIYRFSGCDLEIFTLFNKFFNESKILKIENTYRNSQELINVAGNFVMKNKLQIKKELKSNKSVLKPIKVCYNCSLKRLIKMIKGNIMILGRNNKDIYEVIDNNFVLNKDKSILYKEDSSIKLKYMTVHGSKGLECDNVIILNVIDDELGFPNKIEDDKILRFVSKKDYKTLYDEERRLFYVALTRTKNNVYLITKKNRESIFIKELIKDYYKYIEIIK